MLLLETSPQALLPGGRGGGGRGGGRPDAQPSVLESVTLTEGRLTAGPVCQTAVSLRPLPAESRPSRGRESCPTQLLASRHQQGPRGLGALEKWEAERVPPGHREHTASAAVF